MLLTKILNRIKNHRFIKPTLEKRAFRKDMREFSTLSKSMGRKVPTEKEIHMQLHDKTSSTLFDRHYIYHPAWAARVLKETNPSLHIDISSILSFSTILSAFIPTEFYDYRPADISLSSFKSKQADLLALPFETSSINSLSCMHTVEHVGLGRYGDPLDPNADIKACSELARVLAPNGVLLFVVPVGKESTIHYNAHRIYSYDDVLSMFKNLSLVEYTLVALKGGDPIKNATKEDTAKEYYGCGCFWFTKK